MDDPMIREMETWGYPKEYEHRHVMTDSRNNEIYAGDEYLEMDDDIYLIAALEESEVTELLRNGAIRKNA